jgi:hypothetical protein
MSSISSISPSSFSPHLQDHQLRRILRAELAEVKKMMEESAFSDELTHVIDVWRENFLKAIQSTLDEKRVLSEYTELMQQVLCDSLTKSPLDEEAYLGNDGKCYSKLSLAVYQITTREPFAGRSPLFPEDPKPFQIKPHLVARHLVKWLKSHDALIEPKELKQRYLNLLAKNALPSKEERVKRIMQRKKELDQIDVQKRKEQEEKLVQSFEERFEALSKRVSRLAIKDKAEKRRLGEHLEANHLAHREDLAEIEKMIALSGQEDDTSFEKLKAILKKYIGEKLEPLKKKVEEYAKETIATLEKLAKKEEEELKETERQLENLNIEMGNLSEETAKTAVKIHDVSKKLDSVEKQEKELQIGVEKTRKALQEMKKRQNNELLTAIIVVGVAIILPQPIIYF